jgi:hypothetical protein
MVTGESLAILQHAKPTAAIRELLQRDYVVVFGRFGMGRVAAMRCTKSAFALAALRDGCFVTSNVQGIITRKEMMHRLASDIELFGV